MFGFLFRRAQATVDNAIIQVAYGALVVLPALVALVFATMAAVIYLGRMYEPEVVYAIIACGYALIALFEVLAFRFHIRSLAGAASEEAQSEQTAEAAADDAALSEADHKLLLSALTSAGPIVVPAFLKGAVRNLPLLVAIAAAILVLMQTHETKGEGATPVPTPEPAE